VLTFFCGVWLSDDSPLLFSLTALGIGRGRRRLSATKTLFPLTSCIPLSLFLLFATWWFLQTPSRSVTLQKNFSPSFFLSSFFFFFFFYFFFFFCFLICRQAFFFVGAPCFSFFCRTGHFPFRKAHGPRPLLPLVDSLYAKAHFLWVLGSCSLFFLCALRFFVLEDCPV